MRAIDYQCSPALSPNHIQFKGNIMQALTVSSIAELVPTSSNKLTQRGIEPDLSHYAVK